MADKLSNTGFYFSQKDMYLQSLQKTHVLKSFYNAQLDIDSFQDRLQYAMELRNVNHKRLAELAGVEPITVHRAIHGKNTPRESTVELFATALKVRAEWLLMKDYFITEEEKENAEKDFDKLKQTVNDKNDKIREEALQVFADDAGFTILPAAEGGIIIIAQNGKILRLSKEMYGYFMDNIRIAFSAIVGSSLQNFFMMQPDPHKIDRRY